MEKHFSPFLSGKHFSLKNKVAEPFKMPSITQSKPNSQRNLSNSQRILCEFQFHYTDSKVRAS